MIKFIFYISESFRNIQQTIVVKIQPKETISKKDFTDETRYVFKKDNTIESETNIILIIAITAATMSRYGASYQKAIFSESVTSI